MSPSDFRSTVRFMQAAYFEKTMRRTYRIDSTRAWRVTGAVMLAHAGLVWLASSALLTSAAPTGQSDNVIIAIVVMDATAAPVPESARPKVQAHIKPLPQAKPVTQQVPLATALTAAAPSDAAPIVPAAASAPLTPAAPPASGKQDPAANATAAAVVLPSTDADYLNNPAPLYPRVSKRMGEEGTVVVRVLITPEGRAEKAEVRTSSGFARLDDTALSTVQRWRFVPGKRHGVPEAMWFNVPIRFVLD